MKKITVKQGDTILRIAKKYKLPFKKIWEAVDNKQLKEKRNNDPDLLMPGDKLFIPDPETIGRSADSNQKHTYRYTQLKREFYLELVSPDGQSLADHSYKLVVGDIKQEGKCNEPIDIELPIELSSGELTIFDSNGVETEKLELQFDHLNPYDEEEDAVSAIQARLNNLGYFSGEVDGKLGPLTVGAIKHFQADNDQEPTGKPRDIIDLLKKKYGS